MFTAKAKHWVNYNGVWHPKGEAFPIDDADIQAMRKHADITQTAPEPPKEPEPKTEQAQEPEPVKRGRKRKK